MRLSAIRALCFAAWLAFATGAPAAAALHAGDQVQVTVYNHPELSGTFTIDASERISLPLAGAIDVHGLDSAQIASRVQRALDPYVIRAAVEVQLKVQTSSLFISGGPGGVLKYEPGETLSAALADLQTREANANTANAKDGAQRSGDLLELQRTRVDLHRVGVRRDGKLVGTFDAVQLSARGDAGPRLLPEDEVVLVNKPNQIRVSGEVAKPGFAYLWDEEPLSDAIAQAGGILPTAASSHIALERGGSVRLLALGSTQINEPGLPGDSIAVPAAPRINVSGLVTTPGPVVLKTDFSLLAALYTAGGPTKWADLSKVQVVHDSTKSTYNVSALVHGDMSQNPGLQDGDMVFVPEGHKVDYQQIFGNIVTALSLGFFVKP